MKQQMFLAMLVSLILWAEVLHSEVLIEISHGVDSARPIGVVPFKWTGSSSTPEDIGSIVAADLLNSGKFKPLDPLHLPQIPSTIQEIKPAAWSALGVDTVVVGRVIPNPDNSYNIIMQLVDTSSTSGTIIMQNSYKVNEQFLRYAGHTISNAIFEKLTGIKGAFCTRIAYVTQTNDYKFPYELCIADYDGYNQSIVHRSSQHLMSPAWSSDGSKLAYVTFESGHSTLVIQNLANGAICQVASFPRHNGAPSFSPDGTKLAFALSKTGSLNLYVMNLNSGQINQITDSRNSNNTEPSWFPDSQNLAFTSDQTGRPQIYKININGGTMQRITWDGSQNQDADVSRDGKFIVIVNSSNGQQHIAKQDLLTGNIQILSSSFLDETPSLSPNGTMIIYSSSQEDGSMLNLISIDGHFKSNLPAAGKHVKFPAWSPYL